MTKGVLPLHTSGAPKVPARLAPPLIPHLIVPFPLHTSLEKGAFFLGGRAALRGTPRCLGVSQLLAVMLSSCAELSAPHELVSPAVTGVHQGVLRVLFLGRFHAGSSTPPRSVCAHHSEMLI